jgi:hypothetical protein
MRKMVLAAVAMACWAGGITRAQAAGGVHEHDGLYLNMDLGGGGLTSRNSAIDYTLSGGAGSFSIALGGALTPNFVIAGRYWGVAVSSPSLNAQGVSYGSASDTTLGLSGIGLDLTYYFMPLNLYLTATPSFGIVSLQASGTTYKTDNGFALRLAAGKEWWVSDNWGVGIDLQYAHSSNNDAGTSWASNWFGVAFSATYN